MRWQRGALMTLGVAALLMTGGLRLTPAAADEWGTPAVGLKPDGPRHTWCFTNSMDGHDGLKDAVVWAMNVMTNQTHMWGDREPCGGGETDVILHEAHPIDTHPGARAVTQCVEWTKLF